MKKFEKEFSGQPMNGGARMCVCEIGGGNKVSEVKSTIRSVRVPAPASCSKIWGVCHYLLRMSISLYSTEKRCKFLPLDKIGALPHAPPPPPS